MARNPKKAARTDPPAIKEELLKMEADLGKTRGLFSVEYALSCFVESRLRLKAARRLS